MADNEYYDEVDEDAYKRSAENRSVPTPESRALWQNGNVSTDGNGPNVEDVTPIFAQARADALASPVTADDDDEALRDNQADQAADAQERADAIRNSEGYAAPTGADAGNYDDPKLEEAVPAENFNAAPNDDEDAASEEDAANADDSGTTLGADDTVAADESDATVTSPVTANTDEDNDFATRENEDKSE